jgi:hypothetical protein
MAELSSLVLRFPHDDGEHVYRVAKLRPEAIADLSDRLMCGVTWDETGAFGPPLNISQAVDEIDTRDFKVLDVE